MKLFSKTTQKLSDSFMHYVRLRFQFRSSVLKEPLPKTETDTRTENGCSEKS